MKRSISALLWIVLCQALDAQNYALGWCMDKPLIKEDTLALIKNHVRKISVYETSIDDSSGTIPAHIWMKGEKKQPLYVWEVMGDSAKLNVKMDGGDTGSVKWRITKTARSTQTFTQYEVVQVPKGILFFKYICYSDSSGRFVRSERYCSSSGKNGEQKNYGLMIKEEFIYRADGLLREIRSSEYEPLPNNKKISRRNKVVFFYE